ncbi:cytochrome-b5 reductase [Malassezia pachydermatis]|uniref:Cytochrome b5 n=1 Tax=Malassezia pachydermatis TaxID=77020 RepID=A0A0M8MN85_9BASI|nr:cytochrome b5 [Malassezia pachydermatis]KOS15906.1 cytochrome b5 [Malassezia pachydermatis]
MSAQKTPIVIDGTGPTPSAQEEGDDTPPAFPALNSAQRHASPQGASTLRPPATSRLAPTGMSSLRMPMAAGASLNPPAGRKKVVLEPGCSPLDWARLKSTTDLRGGVTTLLRVTPSELKKHNTKEDAWTALQGKVYNITPYLRFHPGGQDTLMRVAGRDGTRLFFNTHAWVNIDAIIDTAMVGIYVQE